jgi:hypothetical protein
MYLREQFEQERDINWKSHKENNKHTGICGDGYLLWLENKLKNNDDLDPVSQQEEN